MEQKHEKIKSQVADLIKKSKSEKEISKLLDIPLGSNFRDRFSIKWYIRCIQLKNIASLGGKAVHKKYPDLNKRLVKFMHLKTKEKVKNDSEFAKYMHKKAIERGKITLTKNPEHFKEMAKISHQNTKIYRKDNKYNENYCVSRLPGAKKGGKIAGPNNIKIMRKSLTQNILSKGGKKGGPIGGRKTVEILRKRKGMKYGNVYFDSAMELECARLFMKYNIVNNFTEGYDCHVKIGTKDFDFFPQRKLFVEFHPLSIFDPNETYESYYNKRRFALNDAGYSDYPLIILTNLNEFEEKVLFYFKNEKK